MGKEVHVEPDTAAALLAAAHEVGAEWALVSSAEGVCWATGHPVPLEPSPSPFAGGPTLALVDRDGCALLIGTNAELATDEPQGGRIPYAGVTAGGPEDYLANYLAALREALAAARIHGAVAVEAAQLPWRVAAELVAHSHQPVDATAAFARARAVKTERELGLLRRSAGIAALAQVHTASVARAGMTELELFASLRSVVETAAGTRVPMAGDLLSGRERTSAAGGWASPRAIADGDLIISDLAPRVSGYWADSCNTFLGSGRVAPAVCKAYDAVAEALQTAAAAAQPGTPVSHIDQMVRRSLSRRGLHYRHHTGHGIGTSVHEYPRIIPGEHAELQPGMVILLEPGAYDPEWGGIRLEHMFEITADGPRQLTDFPQHLERGAGETPVITRTTK